MKKIFAWIVAFALCFSLLLTGCNEFSGNYSRQLTAEELDTKLSGADLEDFDSAASGTEVTGYQMKFDTGISISVKVDETDTEMEIDAEAESTIFKGMSAEEAEHKVEEGLRKAKQTTEEAEDNADADVNTDTDASADRTAEQESAEHTEATEEGEDDGNAN